MGNCQVCPWWWPYGKQERLRLERERMVAITADELNRKRLRRQMFDAKITEHENNARFELANNKRQEAINELQSAHTYRVIKQRLLEMERHLANHSIQLESFDDMRDYATVLRDIAITIGRSSGRSFTAVVESTNRSLQSSMDNLKNVQESLATEFKTESTSVPEVTGEELLAQFLQNSTEGISFSTSYVQAPYIPTYSSPSLQTDSKDQLEMTTQGVRNRTYPIVVSPQEERQPLLLQQPSAAAASGAGAFAQAMTADSRAFIKHV